MRFKPLAALSLLAIVFLALSCAGAGGDLDEKQAGAAANRYVKTYFGLLDGSTSGRQLVDIFAPECRADVDAGKIDFVATVARAMAPTVAQTRIEGLDLGKLNFEKTADGISVTTRPGSHIRIKVHGAWVSAQDYFNLVGIGGDESDNVMQGEDALLLVKRDGKWFIGDCSLLQDQEG